MTVIELLKTDYSMLYLLKKRELLNLMLMVCVGLSV